MNDEQIIAEVCKKCGLDFTLGDLEALTELCRNYFDNRHFLMDNNSYQNKVKQCAL